MANENTKVYREQGGARLVVKSGGEIDLQGGGKLKLGAIYGVDSIGFAPAAGAANVCEVTITLKDADGNAVAAPANFDTWLSDAATGEGLTATTASGAVAAKAASGTDLVVLVAKKATRVQCKATGVYVLSITDIAKTGFYVCAQNPFTGKTHVSAQLIAGNYG